LQLGSGCKQPGRTAVATWLWLQAARAHSSCNLAQVASSQGAQQLQFGSGCKQPGRTAVAIWLWLQATSAHSSCNLALVASSQGAQQLQLQLRISKSTSLPTPPTGGEQCKYSRMFVYKAVKL